MKYLLKFNENNYHSEKLYHILDMDKLMYVINNNKMSTYKASSGGISTTRNKMMNSYLGESGSAFFKLELNKEKLQKKFKIKPFKYKTHSTGYLEEWEEMIQTSNIENAFNYIDKIIIIKHKIERLKEDDIYKNRPSNYFTTRGTPHKIRNIPDYIKWLKENSPVPIYVQEGSIIKRDDEYIDSLINHKLHKSKFKYGVWLRGTIKIKDMLGGYKDHISDEDGKLYPNWYIGQEFPKTIKLHSYNEALKKFKSINIKNIKSDKYDYIEGLYLIEFEDIGEKWVLSSVVDRKKYEYSYV